MLVRGICYGGWHPSYDRLKAAHDQDFCEAMRREWQGPGALLDAERVAQAVLRVIDRHFDRGQIEHAVEALPKQVRRLWGAAEEEASTQ
jgi:uncharacterized protein (DUF2267 family)